MKSMSMDEEEEEDRPVEIRNDKDNSCCLYKYIPDMSPKSVLLFSLVWNTLFTASQVRYAPMMKIKAFITHTFFLHYQHTLQQTGVRICHIAFPCSDG